MAIYIKDASIPPKGSCLELRIHENGLVQTIKGAGPVHTEAYNADGMAMVVFCKDCAYCSKKDPYELWCAGFCCPARLVTPYDFCSRGKRAE